MSFISTKNIKGDLFGGITAGIVALPLALAFGIQAFGGIDNPSASSVGALAGLVGATLLGCFASIFGLSLIHISLRFAYGFQPLAFHIRCAVGEKRGLRF